MRALPIAAAVWLAATSCKDESKRAAATDPRASSNANANANANASGSGRRAEPPPSAAKRPHLAFPSPPEARVLREPRPAGGPDVVQGAWCFEGKDAEAAAKLLTDALSSAGWNHVTSRGTGDRIGVGAVYGEQRISLVVGGTDQACNGALATGTLAELRGVEPIQLEPGEKIR